MSVSKGEVVAKLATILGNGEGEQKLILGDHVTIKIPGEQSGGLFSMIEQNNEAGAGIPLHVHTREDETFYVCDGEITFFLDGKEILGGTGATVFLPKGVPHGFRVNKRTRSLVITSPAGIENMFRKLAELPAGPPDMEKVRQICGEYGITFL
jgi:quercetin dioxygenase-like cupin family protein